MPSRNASSSDMAGLGDRRSWRSLATFDESLEIVGVGQRSPVGDLWRPLKRNHSFFWRPSGRSLQLQPLELLHAAGDRDFGRQSLDARRAEEPDDALRVREDVL